MTTSLLPFDAGFGMLENFRREMNHLFERFGDGEITAFEHYFDGKDHDLRLGAWDPPSLLRSDGGQALRPSNPRTLGPSNLK